MNPQVPQTPAPSGDFNNEADAQAQADRWAATENHGTEKQMIVHVVPYYVANGATEPFDMSGVFKFGQYRPQPFPVSAFVWEGYIIPTSQVPGSGTSGFLPKIRPSVDSDGNKILQYTRDQTMVMCQAEFEETTGSTKPFTQTLPSKVLIAGGINPPETPEGFGAPCPAPNEGSYWVVGYQPVGTTAVRDGITYQVVQIPLMQRWDPVVV